jgi:chemotaxis protein MotB
MPAFPPTPSRNPMSRRKKQAEHENHDRWLVSYADFITLLFAFFVVMFASSHADKGKAQQVSDSVKRALEQGRVGHATAALAAILGGAADQRGPGNAARKGPGGAIPEGAKPGQLAELFPSMKVLSEELKSEIEAGRIDVRMEARGLVVSFKQAALFPSGEDGIAAAAYESLEKVARAIQRVPNPVRLEGHTDSVPIHTGRFRNNWELSAARAIALLELMATRFAVDRARMSIGGYADSAPLASNSTEEGRARNRRADVILLNERGMLAEPGKR